ncbi:hypothetical protein EI94DRAFT_1029926 [Lactarius quietus]|nr:hypothetical protein EI94DRAFT_1029926 [Lactarius quietus]
MQGFSLLLLAASLALMGNVVPVESAMLARGATNAQRLARNIGSLAPSPVKRGGAWRLPFSENRSTLLIGSFASSGEAQSRFAATDPARDHWCSPGAGRKPNCNWLCLRRPERTGLNVLSNTSPTDTNVLVSFANGSLLAEGATGGPTFSPPYIGGSGPSVLSPTNLNTIQFTNIPAGSQASNWTFAEFTAQLNMTWTNSDGTIVTPTLIYNVEENLLSFTDNPTGLFNANSANIPVNLFITQ